MKTWNVVRPVSLVLPVLLFSALPARAQVRPGLAHEIQALEAKDTLAEPATRNVRGASHDPDSDGALIGAAVGAIGLTVLGSAACDGPDVCGYLVVGGAVLGGLIGLLAGAVVDAADPFTDRQAVAQPDIVIPPPVAAAPADSAVAEGDEPERLRRCSGQSDLVGAVVGAGLFGYMFAGAGSKPALTAAAIGALLGVGIGSLVEDAGQEGCPPRETARSPADSAAAERNESP